MSEESDSHTRTSPFLQRTCREIVDLTGRGFLQPVWAVTVLYWTWEDARTKQIENNSTNVTHSTRVFGLNTTYTLSPCPGWRLWPESDYQSKCLIRFQTLETLGSVSCYVLSAVWPRDGSPEWVSLCDEPRVSSLLPFWPEKTTAGLNQTQQTACVVCGLWAHTHLNCVRLLRVLVMHHTEPERIFGTFYQH